MMTAVIRSDAAADAAAITSVFLASRAATMAYLPRLYDDEQTAAWITHVVLPHCQVWVAQSPEVVGFVAVRDNHIRHLYLHPDHQRQGIGTQLLEQARSVSPAGLTLRVFVRNIGARTFYERRGFRLLDDDDGSRNEENEPDMTFGWTRPR